MMMGLEVILLIGVVAVVIWSMQRSWSPMRREGPEQDNSALDILDTRYARGEIDRDEFEERRALLGG